MLELVMAQLEQCQAEPLGVLVGKCGSVNAGSADALVRTAPEARQLNPSTN